MPALEKHSQRVARSEISPAFSVRIKANLVNVGGVGQDTIPCLDSAK